MAPSITSTPERRASRKERAELAELVEIGGIARPGSLLRKASRHQAQAGAAPPRLDRVPRHWYTRSRSGHHARSRIPRRTTSPGDARERRLGKPPTEVRARDARHLTGDVRLRSR